VEAGGAGRPPAGAVVAETKPGAADAKTGAGTRASGAGSDARAATSPTDAKASGDRGATAGTARSRVNINAADVKELMTLDGIGRAVAQRIVEYRRAHGPFKKPEEIRRVSGVGPGLWERNRDRIVVE